MKLYIEKLKETIGTNTNEKNVGLYKWKPLYKG